MFEEKGGGFHCWCRNKVCKTDHLCVGARVCEGQSHLSCWGLLLPFILDTNKASHNDPTMRNETVFIHVQFKFDITAFVFLSARVKTWLIGAGATEEQQLAVCWASPFYSPESDGISRPSWSWPRPLAYLSPSFVISSSGADFSFILHIYFHLTLTLIQTFAAPVNFHFFLIVAPAKWFRLLLGTLDKSVGGVSSAETSKGRGVGRQCSGGNPVWRVHPRKQAQPSRWVSVWFFKDLGSFQTASSVTVYKDQFLKDQPTSAGLIFYLLHTVVREVFTADIY